MAHELAHIRNRDTLIMTVTATIAGAISMLGNFAFFIGGRDAQSRWRDRHIADDHRGAAGGHAGADGDQPHARILCRPRRRRNLRQARWRWLPPRAHLRCGASHRERHGRGQSGHRAYVHHQPACRGSAWTICSRPIPRPRTGSLHSQPSRRKWGRVPLRIPSANAGPWSRSASSPRGPWG